MDDLLRQIDGIASTWRQRAQLNTMRLVKQRRFSGASLWGEIKPLLMRLQRNKCAFCERQLEGLPYGAIEFDVDHFRPKAAVKAWPGRRSRFQYKYSTGKAGKRGYYWLAYDPLNFAAVCKPCNTPLKGGYFPIAGRRGGATQSSQELNKREKPFLCLPLCNIDVDAERLVSFEATVAVPSAKAGPRRRRGQVIIDFFDLNGRDSLHAERARTIVLLGNALVAIQSRKATKHDRELATKIVSLSAPHSGCARAFLQLWKYDRSTARKALEQCKALAIQ